MTLKQERDEQKKALRLRELRIESCFSALLTLEEQCGHTGVLAAIKMWLNKPKRGKFL